MPNSLIKEILMQPNSNGKRGRWIEKFLEYDLEIKTKKLDKGQGLAKLLTERNCKDLGIHEILNNLASNQDISNGDEYLQVHEKFLSSIWHKDIVYFL